MRPPKLPPAFGILLEEELKSDSSLLFRQEQPSVRPLIERANNEGWNWEDCGYRAHQVNLTARQFWVLVKIARAGDRQSLPLKDPAGLPFTYRLPPVAHRILHQIDIHLGGTIGTAFPQVTSDADRSRYLLTSLREEAISSSLIEGAVTTRQAAKEMLRVGRSPRTPGERMIANNYRTIQMLNERRGQRLTPDLLCEVQKCLTTDTLENPDAAGRFRHPEETVAIWDTESGECLYAPPPAEDLPDRINRLCDFANTSATGENATHFIHPAIRAILLHFWLAYDHPFVDGNGRTARALFYWSMLRSGYWLVEYLTISTVISGQTKQYARAYLNSEQDDNDLTYFILYHLGVIERSLIAFREYLDRKTREQQEAVVLLAGPFNSRQRAILRLALRDPTARFTYRSHANSHGIAIFTARADLLHLKELALLNMNRTGRQFEFTPVARLESRIEQMAHRP